MIAKALVSSLAVFFLTRPAVLAQTGLLRESPHFERLSSDQGLSNSLVYCILQDSQGLMWFGVRDGLNRFDGYQFSVYRPDPDDPGAISTNRVFTLCEDRQSALWIGGDSGGLNRYDRATNAFTHFRHDPEDPNSLASDKISVIGEDGEGRIWIGFEGEGLSYLHPNQPNRFRHFKHDPNDPHNLNNGYNWIRAMHRDRQGVLWFGSNRGLVRYDADRDQLIRHIPFPDDRSQNNRILAIHEDRSGALWVALGSRLARFDRQTGVFEVWTPKTGDFQGHGEIRALAEDERGALWIGSSESGLYRVDPSRASVARFQPDRSDPYSLGHDSINALFTDRSNVLWIGADGGGVHRLSQNARAFGRLRLSTAIDLEAEPKTLALWRDRRRNLWVGARRGLFLFDEQNRLRSRFGEETFGDDWIWALREDRRGAMWVGTSSDGLHRLTPTENGFSIASYRSDPEDPASLSYNGVMSLLEDRQGDVWAGTAAGGLNRLDVASGRFTRFVHDADNPSSLTDNTPFTLCQDSRDFIWVGMYTGLNRIHPADPNDVVRYQNQPNRQDSLGRGQVRAILEASDGVIWVGLEGGGLNRLDRQTGRFRRYRQEHGLPSNLVYGILEDGQGRLWLSTNGGLARFDPRAEAVEVFDVHDGLQSNEFSFGAAFKDPDGALYFGGAQGFHRFFADAIRANPTPPPVVLTDFLLNNRPAKPKPGSPLTAKIGETREVRLSYKQNLFAFEFAALDYANPQKNQYQYMMENLDEDWIDTPADRRFAVYTNLDGGAYRFKVRAANRDGVWGQAASVRVIIGPPPWKTWQAYTLYALAVAFLAGSYLRLQRKKLIAERAVSQSLEHKVAERTQALETKNAEILEQQRQLAAQAERLEHMDQLKTRFFTNISHEFRTPLTLTLGPLEDSLTADGSGALSRQDLTMMRRNGNRLKKLIDELLDISKLEAGQMKPRRERGDLAAFTRRCAEPFQTLAKRHGVAFTVKGDQPIDAAFDPDMLEKVIHNLLSNAFKFTNRGGEVAVQLEAVSAGARVRVKDTGSGIPADQLPHVFDRFYQAEAGGSYAGGSGVGLALSKELVELHGGRIRVVSEPGFGSEFTIELPEGQADADAPERADGRVPGSDLSEDVAFHEPEEGDAGGNAIAETSDDAATLLIVEDNADVRAYLTSRLGRHYRVIEAQDGAAGFALAREQVPDLVISDVMMPVADGFTLCRRLKSDELTNHIPVILLTAKASIDNQRDGLETGADDYVVKPFDTGLLLQRVQNLIESRKTLRQRYSAEVLLKPGDIIVASADQAFVKKVMEAIEAHSRNARFGVHELAEEVGLSRRQLQRKLTAIANQTPAALLRQYRLERARQLLEKKIGNVSEIAYQTGFSTPQIFSAHFRRAYGKTPSEYAKEGRARLSPDAP